MGCCSTGVAATAVAVEENGQLLSRGRDAVVVAADEEDGRHLLRCGSRDDAVLEDATAVAEEEKEGWRLLERCCV